MTVKSGFFNSLNGDRKYTAEEMNMPYKKLISNGVIPSASNSLQVLANNGLKVTVKEGAGLFGDAWAYNDADVVLTLEAAHSVLNRKDLIVMRWDNNTDVRDINLFVKTGTPATSPVVPTVERSANIQEYALAEVHIAAGATVITQSNITDTRADSSRCGWCVGLIQQVDTSTLFAQWQAAYEEQFAENWNAFNEWFNEIESFLSDDESAAAQLLNLTQNKADRTALEISLTASGWTLTSGYYYQTKAAEGVKVGDIILVSPAVADIDKWAINGVVCTEQAAGTLKFRANTAVAVTANVVNLGGGI